MKRIIITNNDLVYNNYNTDFEIVFNENYSILDVLKHARNYVHKNYIVLTHPLSGSVKPYEVLFKSIIIMKNEEEKLDMDSLSIIEDSIVTVKKFTIAIGDRKYSQALLDDYKLIDFDLIKNCID